MQNEGKKADLPRLEWTLFRAKNLRLIPIFIGVFIFLWEVAIGRIVTHRLPAELAVVIFAVLVICLIGVLWILSHYDWRKPMISIGSEGITDQFFRGTIPWSKIEDLHVTFDTWGKVRLPVVLLVVGKSLDPQIMRRVKLKLWSRNIRLSADDVKGFSADEVVIVMKRYYDLYGPRSELEQKS